MICMTLLLYRQFINMITRGGLPRVLCQQDHTKVGAERYQTETSCFN
jgi:hypothetical protein